MCLIIDRKSQNYSNQFAYERTDGLLMKRRVGKTFRCRGQFFFLVRSPCFGIEPTRDFDDMKLRINLHNSEDAINRAHCRTTG